MDTQHPHRIVDDISLVAPAERARFVPVEPSHVARVRKMGPRERRQYLLANTNAFVRLTALPPELRDQTIDALPKTDAEKIFAAEFKRQQKARRREAERARRPGEQLESTSLAVGAMRLRALDQLSAAARDVVLESTETELRDALADSGQDFDDLARRGRAAAQRAIDHVVGECPPEARS